MYMYHKLNLNVWPQFRLIGRFFHQMYGIRLWDLEVGVHHQQVRCILEQGIILSLYEPQHQKTNNLHKRKR